MAPRHRLTRHLRLLIFIYGVAALLLSSMLPHEARASKEKKTVKFTHACVITQKMDTMRDFYREVLQVEPKVYQEDYLEFPLEGAILSLYKQESLEKTVPGAMQAGRNKSVLLEFQVADVDQEYARLKKGPLGIDWVMSPTTFPWGNRSIYFRDPEGNMVNLYSTVKSP